jgi:hypothetical protein
MRLLRHPPRLLVPGRYCVPKSTASRLERKRRQARQRIVQAAEELFLARLASTTSRLATSPSAPEPVNQTTPPPHEARTEAVAPLVLALCAQATDPEGYARHRQLVEQYPERRARDAVRMQQSADKRSDPPP